MDKDMPADWAIERAVELSNAMGSTWNVTSAKYAFQAGDGCTLNTFARYIEAHEQPPVDPDLVTAREICALVWEHGCCLGTAALCRKGEMDDVTAVQFALAKLKEARGK